MRYYIYITLTCCWRQRKCDGLTKVSMLHPLGTIRNLMTLQRIAAILNISVWTKVVEWPYGRSADWHRRPWSFAASVAKTWLMQYRWYWLAPQQPVFLRGQSTCHFMLLQHLTFLLCSHIMAEPSHPSNEIPHLHGRESQIAAACVKRR